MEFYDDSNQVHNEILNHIDLFSNEFLGKTNNNALKTLLI